MCFVWGIWEYKKPKDQGPLFIDLDRTIRKRLKTRESSTRKTSASEQAAYSRERLATSDLIEKSRSANANETIRIRGDVKITKGEVIPYNMIVEGNMVSQEDVTFLGGLHVKGRSVIGARNQLKKSIICQKDLLICEDVIVYNCIDCEGFVFIKNGVRVGVGVEGGGIASGSAIYLQDVEGPLRIHSKEGIRIVANLKDVIPEELQKYLEVRV